MLSYFKVIIADTNSENIRQLSLMLTDYHVRDIFLCFSATDTWQTLQKNSVQVLFLNTENIASSSSLLRKIMSHPDFSETHIIVMSSVKKTDSVIPLLQKGAMAHLTIPFKKDSLAGALDLFSTQRKFK